MKIRPRNQIQETAVSERPKNKRNDKQKGKNRKFGKDITQEGSNKTKKATNKPVYFQVVQEQKQTTEVQEYQTQIIEYVLKRQKEEKLFSIDHQYLKKCNYLNIKTRNFVVKYIMKIGKSYKLKRTTLSLATFYMDFYFSHYDSLDTQGIILYTQAALFIAMKYQEIYPPQLYEWVNRSKIKEVLLAQANILKMLDFKLSYYSLENFIEYYSSKKKLTGFEKETINFLVDMTLFDETMYRFKPSLLARSIIDSVTIPGKMDEKMELNIKWMIQRNQKISHWLKDFQYQRLK